MTLAKLFKAYDVRATYPEPLNEAAARRIGYGAGQFLNRQGAGARAQAALVSRDMRPHSESLCQALAQGLQAAGVNVIDLGMTDTSFQYFAINYLDAVGGIQTTASHNPLNYNGFKISGRGAVPIGVDSGLRDVQKLADEAPEPGSMKPVGSLEKRDLWREYRQHVLKFLKPLKRKMRLVVDASNGMAGKMVPAVFEGVENLEIVRLNFEIGGKFAHEPNPLVAENMVPTQEAVRKERAELGACFDGDADRCIFTDERGNILSCDHLTALLCGHFLAQAPGAAVIYDLRSSKVVEEEIRRLGGQPVRSRVGHVFIKALLRQSGGIFGGELSGHFYFRDNFCCDSGAIALCAVLSVLAEADRPISELIRPFQKYPQSGEINFRVQDKDAVLGQLKQQYGNYGVDELDGVTVDAWDRPEGGWWFNVRPSNTEPLLRLNAEARDRRRLEAILAELRPLLGQPGKGH